MERFLFEGEGLHLTPDNTASDYVEIGQAALIIAFGSTELPFKFVVRDDGMIDIYAKNDPKDDRTANKGRYEQSVIALIDALQNGRVYCFVARPDTGMRYRIPQSFWFPYHDKFPKALPSLSKATGWQPMLEGLPLLINKKPIVELRIELQAETQFKDSTVVAKDAHSREGAAARSATAISENLVRASPKKDDLSEWANAHQQAKIREIDASFIAGTWDKGMTNRPTIEKAKEALRAVKGEVKKGRPPGS